MMMLMLVGTYTRNTGSEGVYAFEVSPDCREIAERAVTGGIDNPSWLAWHPRLPVVYAVNEIRDYAGGGSISAFSCDAGGGLTLLHRTASMGADPCHLAIDARGSRLVASNYSEGSFAAWPIAPDGRLGALAGVVRHNGRGTDPARQAAPHVHSACIDDGGEYLWVADLGLDQLVRYALSVRATIDREGRFVIRVSPGAGPRLFCFDPAGRYGYLINELDNTIVSFRRAGSADLEKVATFSTLPDDFAGTSYCAHIQMSADGRYLYASNRGHDSVAVFEVAGDGSLRAIQFQATGGGHPRHFALSPDEGCLLVANRDGGNIVVFDRDPDSGRLGVTGKEIAVPAPVCVLFR